MSRALVLGASGAIGRFLVARLLERGDDVIAISRKERISAEPRLRWITGDLHTGLPPLPACDVLYSLGPLDAFAQWFAQAHPVAPHRVIACSSMSAESKRASSDRGERATAERLQQAERTLADAADARGSSWTVFRPTLVYGAGVDRSLAPIARFAQRWRVFPRILDDLAAACVALSVRDETAGKIYTVGGGERLAFSSMLERVRDSLPVYTVAVPIPLAAVSMLLGVAAVAGAQASHAAVERLRFDLVADNTAAAADFGWAPRGFRPGAEAWTPLAT
jgi:nucleoside-diphosphate-sugar epimerase